MKRLLILVVLLSSFSAGSLPEMRAAHASSAPRDAGSNATPTPLPDTGQPDTGQIVATAEQYIGYPYAYIGDDPSTGFSCIGFVHFVYAQNGIYVPEDLGKAYDSAPHIDQRALQPGDLVFFQNTVWNGISHVDIYIGNGKMIGADSFQTGVQEDALSDQYWQDHYLGATRPISNPTGTPLDPTPTATTTPAPQASGTPGPPPVPTEPSLHIKAGTRLVPRHTTTVYSGPGTTYDTIDTVTAGATLTAVQTQGQWINITYDDGTQYGWVHGPDVTTPKPDAQSGQSTSASGHNSSPPAPRTAATRTPRQDVKGFHASNPAPRSLVVTADILFVRAAPDSHARILRRVRAGDRLKLLRQQGDWDYIEQRDGSRGWVSARWVR